MPAFEPELPVRGSHFLTAMACASIATLTSTVALSQVGPIAPIGKVVKVSNRMTATDAGLPRPLAAGDDVNQNETVDVAPDAAGELKLNDETKLALGGGAKLKLEKFAYDASRPSGTIAVDILKGPIRFVTGNANKPAYLIRGPNASISVRGTVLDVYVDGAAAMYVLLHQGAIAVCNKRGECSELKQTCGVLRVGAKGELSKAALWPQQPAMSAVNFDTAFPFVGRPPQIDPAPRASRASIESGNCPAAAEPVVADSKDEKDTKEASSGAKAPEPSARAATAREPDAIATPPPTKAKASSSQPVVVAREARFPDQPASNYPERSAAKTWWAGPYLGIALGGAAMQKRVAGGCRDTGAGAGIFSVGGCDFNADQNNISGGYDPEPDGFIGGGVAGYNASFGTMVVGVEGDLSWGSIDGKASTLSDVAANGVEDATARHELEWFGTLRARLGFAHGDWLLFATGGLAVGDVSMSYAFRSPVSGAYASDTQSKTMAGWVAGVGAEYNLGVVSLKGEILHFDLGDESLSARASFAGGAASGTVFRPKFESEGNLGRVGLNFHFN